MMNTDKLQNKETQKNEYKKTEGQVSPETVFLPEKERKIPLQDNRPNIHSQTVCRFSVLFAFTSEKKSEKNRLQSP